ncbi:MAG: hypothetical protein HOE90_00185 [Bacteriovoracaceae bacterium]|jgi:hypothetical protein|nr:hypothetical protein [Bacteriovoracaceae bacterium]
MKTINESKSKNKSDNYSSLRVKLATKNNAMKILENVNKKDFGMKVSMDELINLSLKNVTKDDIELLQKKSLRNKDRQNIVRQIYCRKVKKVTEDEFIGVTMKDGYFQFLKENMIELEKLGI